MMLQRGLERLYYGTSKSDWRQQLEARASFRSKQAIRISCPCYDNLEWYLEHKHQHYTKDSKASDELNTSKPFVHTTTSESGLHVLRVQPDSVCRLLLGYS